MPGALRRGETRGSGRKVVTSCLLLTHWKQEYDPYRRWKGGKMGKGSGEVLNTNKCFVYKGWPEITPNPWTAKLRPNPHRSNLERGAWDCFKSGCLIQCHPSSALGKNLFPLPVSLCGSQGGAVHPSSHIPSLDILGAQQAQMPPHTAKVSSESVVHFSTVVWGLCGCG